MTLALWRRRRILGLVLTFGSSLAVGRPDIWRPGLQTSWQWQLTGAIDQSVDAVMYDIDLFNSSADVVASLHAKGRYAVCYFSAGSWEPGRPDSGAFPVSVKGASVQGFEQERWLDIRRLDILGPIMKARLDLCKQKGFDGVEPDNVDGFANVTGFPLTSQDQITYNTFLANEAHARGLSVGLKNDLDQVKDLVALFDWALNEQCFEYRECHFLRPFTDSGKAVFHVEYNVSTAQFCAYANSLNFNSLRKNLALDACQEACRTTAAQIPRGGVVNAASMISGAVAPGEVVTIFGRSLGPMSGSVGTINAKGNVDNSLAGTQVMFGSIAAPLLYVRTDQANAVVPYEVAEKGYTQLQIQTAAGVTNSVALVVTDASPGIITVSGTGTGSAAVLNQLGDVNSADNPAARGSVVTLFATGEGQTDPPGVDGRISQGNPPTPRLPVSVWIGGHPATLTYSGALPGLIAGVLQVSCVVPPEIDAGEHVSLVLTVGQFTSQSGVTLAVR